MDQSLGLVCRAVGRQRSSLGRERGPLTEVNQACSPRDTVTDGPKAWLLTGGEAWRGHRNSPVWKGSG